MANILDALMNRVVVETEWLPPIELVRPAAGSGPAPIPGAPSTGAEGSVKIPPLSRLLKPRISIYTAAGGDPVVLAPYGEPANNWPFLRVILVLGGAIGAVVLFRTARELRECRRAKRLKA